MINKITTKIIIIPDLLPGIELLVHLLVSLLNLHHIQKSYQRLCDL
jgi:hypothetical protein